MELAGFPGFNEFTTISLKVLEVSWKHLEPSQEMVVFIMVYDA